MAKKNPYAIQLEPDQIDAICEAELIDRLDYLYQAMAKLQNGEKVNIFFVNDPTSEKVRIADEIFAHETVLQWYEVPEPEAQMEINFTPDFFSRDDKIRFNLDDYLGENDDEREAGC